MSYQLERTLEPLVWQQKAVGRLPINVHARTMTISAELGHEMADFVLFTGYGERDRASAVLLDDATARGESMVIVQPDDRDVPCEPVLVAQAVEEFAAKSIQTLQERNLIREGNVKAAGHSLGGLALAKAFDQVEIERAGLMQPVDLDNAWRIAAADNNHGNVASMFRHDFYRVLYMAKSHLRDPNSNTASLEATLQIGYDRNPFTRNAPHGITRLGGRFKTKFGVVANMDIMPDITRYVSNGGELALTTSLNDPLCRTDDPDGKHSSLPTGVVTEVIPGGHTHLAWSDGRAMVARHMNWLSNGVLNTP
jgi:hypothetical protein